MGAHSNLLDLKASVLLDKFGKGGHVPGSGSAAAFMGLLAAKLIVTVAALTLSRAKYSKHHDAVRKALQDIEGRIYPALSALLQDDAVAFDAVFSSRIARDKAKKTPEFESLHEAAKEELKLATDIPLRIAEACLDLVTHAILIFDYGFEGARGDAGAGLSSAFAGANSAVFIVNLNLKSFNGTYWARHQRTRCDQVRERLKIAHAAADERIGALRIADLQQAKDKDLSGNLKFDIRDSYSDDQILEVVRKLQNKLWRNRAKLWEVAPKEPLATFEPDKALRLLGYSCVIDETLGSFQSPSGRFEVAGLFEANVGRVRLSRQFPKDEILFTAAHELGHAVLHPRMDGAHRDRPKSGIVVSKEPKEREADKFATYFLMPPNLTKERFAASFGTALFILDDDTAFNMGGLRLEEARAKFPRLRDLSRYLAGLDNYAGRQLVSLAIQFRVSKEALAIRLEELDLVVL